MSQREIISYLLTKPDVWVSREELIKELNVCKNTVAHNLVRLVKAGEIERTYERVKVPDKPKTTHVITWVRLTEHYKDSLRKEGLL